MPTPRGRRLKLEVIIAPGATGPPEHIHPLQEERFEVLSGRVGARVEGEERTLQAGEALTVPAGARHTWWGAAEEETRVMVEAEPALETEGFFETVYGLARDGKIGANGQPHPCRSPSSSLADTAVRCISPVLPS